MIDESLRLRLWYENQIGEKVEEMVPLKGGINSSVMKLVSSKGTQVVKSYAQTKDAYLRFSRETSFLKFCSEHAIMNVPKIIEQDEANLILCMNYIDGRKREEPSQFGSAVLAFISDLQEVNRAIHSSLMFAADCTFDLPGLLREINRRIDERSPVENSVTNHEIQFELREIVEVEGFWNRASSFFGEFAREYISPSDIGPHNCLWVGDEAFFIDFEYAGRDSNIKLGLDLLTHPDIGWKQVKPETESLFESVFGYTPDQVPYGLLCLFELKWRLIREQMLQKKHALQKGEDLE